MSATSGRAMTQPQQTGAARAPPIDLGKALPHNQGTGKDKPLRGAYGILPRTLNAR
ncbi:hypothetical protein [Nocardia terpenica]|uniref:Uncharacterized protein n=1 Tax=Nocardia terpenica TaxID=455432 RepID=A0A6G9Z1H0_9NOCA|nr:hypothetical protein [Nocardia terpenica]QIS19207.1 hypothetical protein F6W96_13815 [Nocardia terpenica]